MPPFAASNACYGFVAVNPSPPALDDGGETWSLPPTAGLPSKPSDKGCGGEASGERLGDSFMTRLEVGSGNAPKRSSARCLARSVSSLLRRLACATSSSESASEST